MSDWTEPFGSFMIGAALLLSMIGLWSRYLIGSSTSNAFYGFREMWLYSLPVYAHVMLMVLLCGSCKAFYSSA